MVSLSTVHEKKVKGNDVLSMFYLENFLKDLFPLPNKFRLKIQGAYGFHLILIGST